jgi:5,6-dimethylbenzimidazole synthase
MATLNDKLFTPQDVAALREIILHRRDVRGGRFIDKPVGQQEIDQLLMAALHAPSVGFSQPWDFVLIRDKTIRQQVRDSFKEVNAGAQADFGKRQDQYASLKLEGILEAAQYGGFLQGVVRTGIGSDSYARNRSL